MGQAPRKLTPYASLADFFGAELRRYRAAAGMSHARLGEQVNYSGALISKIEKADRVPSVDLAHSCDRVLGAGGALVRLGLLLQAERQRRHVAPAGKPRKR